MTDTMKALAKMRPEAGLELIDAPIPVAGPEGMTLVAVGARRGSYEPRGPF